MIIHADELAKLILKKSLHECSIEELELLIEQYPYFGPAHFLLTKKMKQDHSSQYEAQVQNTSLYFQNRVWLHHLLNDNNSTGAVIEKKEEPIITEEQKQTITPIITETKEEEAIAENSEEKITEQPARDVETSPETPEPMVATFANDDYEVQLAHEPQPEEIKEQEIIAEISQEKIIEQPGPAVEITKETHESMVATFASENNEVPLSAEPQQEDSREPELTVKTPMLKIEPITGDAPLIFEPYHTVDYFASQGIKFKEEDRPRDRFSAQLKSFTEWLKTMKKIPATEIIATTDAGTEKKVEQMAEYSLAERHVITEAMAEVWKKQGNKARAEDIYNKLSLLDPSKSSYFAAKIEDLKKTS